MDSIINQIKNSWFIICFIGAIIIWYSTVNARLTQAEDDIDDLKVITGEISQLRTDIATIKTSVQFIKEQVQ